GLILVSMNGSGWTCGGPTCTRTDTLAGGSSYPPITVTVDVNATAVSPQVNTVTVSGGGSATATAMDSTAVIPTSPGLSHVNLIWQQDGTNVVSVWYMGGADGSTLLSYKTLSGPISGWRIVGAGDLNGDGQVDFIWQQDQTNVVSVWYMG